MANILIIDDDEMLCDLLNFKLTEMGHKVVLAFNLEDGHRRAAAGNFDVVYLDVRLPDGNGLDKLPVIRKVASSPEIIIMTGLDDPDGAELAIKNGAWDYIQKPSSLNNMLLPLVRALQYRDIKITPKTAVALKREGIIGNSQRIKTCLNQIAQAAGADANVLISGETGTGKELAALAIHNNSARADKNFVTVDCAALSESLVEGILFGHERGAYTGADKAQDGLIKQADGGTLFLDEVGELPLSVQSSFLRVLQEHRYRPLGSAREAASDFRLISVTNRNLDRMVAGGHFRSDLLYRLRSFSMELPPLRERLEDIIDLTIYHTRRICERYGTEIKGLSPEFIQIIKSYSWPGNIRELVNTLERCVAVAGQEPILIPKHLPTEIRVNFFRSSAESVRPEKSADALRKDFPLPPWQDYRDEALGRAEKQYLQNLLAMTGNNIKDACKFSGISRSRLYELLKKHNLTSPANQ